MKIHLSLPTESLDSSVAFYRALLDANPTKRYDDYALFVTEDPALELALQHGPGHRLDARTHFGIAVGDASTVESAIDRLTKAGLHADIEREETCCYAKQTKVWATDPDGRHWEVYYVHEETQERDGDASCCTRETWDTYSTCCAS